MCSKGNTAPHSCGFSYRLWICQLRDAASVGNIKQELPLTIHSTPYTIVEELFLILNFCNGFFPLLPSCSVVLISDFDLLCEKQTQQIKLIMQWTFLVVSVFSHHVNCKNFPSIGCDHQVLGRKPRGCFMWACVKVQGIIICINQNLSNGLVTLFKK